MVPTGAMGVAVGQLFRGGRSYVNYFNIERQGSAGHRMISVNIGKLVAYLGNNHVAGPLLGLNLGYHASLPPFGTHQMLDRHPLDGIGLPGPIGFIGSDGNAECITGIATFQGFFQALDNAAMTMQIGVRLAAMGVFNNVVLFIAYAVMKQDDLVLFDWHKGLCFGSGCAIITRV